MAPPPLEEKNKNVWRDLPYVVLEGHVQTRIDIMQPICLAQQTKKHPLLPPWSSPSSPYSKDLFPKKASHIIHGGEEERQKGSGMLPAFSSESLNGMGPFAWFP
jgi:hypothetical protein